MFMDEVIMYYIFFTTHVVTFPDDFFNFLSDHPLFPLFNPDSIAGRSGKANMMLLASDRTFNKITEFSGF